MTSSEFYFGLANSAAEHAERCERQGERMAAPARRAWTSHDEYKALGEASARLGE